MNNSEIALTAEIVSKYTSWGIDVKKLATFDSKTLENIKRDMTTKLFFHLNRTALYKEARQRGINFEELKPGDVVIMEEEDEGKTRRYHGVVCHTDEFHKKKLSVKVWFPTDGGGIHICHISELVEKEKTKIPMDNAGSSPTDKAKEDCRRNWSSEL